MLSADTIARTLQPRRVLAACGALGVAAAVVTALLTAGPVEPSVRLEHARDLAFSGQPEAALTEVRKALVQLEEDGDPALERKALARAGQLLDLHLGEARAAEALEYYRRLVREYPGSPEAFDAGVRMAEMLRQRFGDDAQASAQFVAVVDAFPTQAGVERLLLRAARIELDRRRWDEARALAERLLAGWPRSEDAREARHLVGMAHHLAGRHVEAAAAFERAAYDYPRGADTARALVDAGTCLAELGEHGLAIARFIEALPDHPEPLLVQKSIERSRRRFVAQRDLKTGKHYAFGGEPTTGTLR